MNAADPLSLPPSPPPPSPPSGSRALIVSGAVDYADPWHPFAETSAGLAALLREEQFEVVVRTDVHDALAGAGEQIDDELFDLVVLNFGETPATVAGSAGAEAAVEGLVRYAEGGGGVLALHASIASFQGVPEWEALLGGRWQVGTTMHPPYGPGKVRVQPGRHPITAGIGDFELADEFYAFVRTADDVRPLATHSHAEREHPLFWARTRGQGRVFYDALGHDKGTFEAPAHAEALRRAVRWLARRPL